MPELQPLLDKLAYSGRISYTRSKEVSGGSYNQVSFAETRELKNEATKLAISTSQATADSIENANNAQILLIEKRFSG